MDDCNVPVKKKLREKTGAGNPGITKSNLQKKCFLGATPAWITVIFSDQLFHYY